MGHRGNSPGPGDPDDTSLHHYHIGHLGKATQHLQDSVLSSVNKETVSAKSILVQILRYDSIKNLIN